jgi:hypothetical protein
MPRPLYFWESSSHMYRIGDSIGPRARLDILDLRQSLIAANNLQSSKPIAWSVY